MLLLSCRSNNLDNNKVSSNDTIKPIDTIEEVAIWADEFIIKYIKANQKVFIETDSIHYAYMKDTTTIDGKKYAIAQIGLNTPERFVTEQWLYIDSLTKNIYEYDVINDSLIFWNDSVQ